MEPNHRALPDAYLTKQVVAELRRLAMTLCIAQALDATQIVAFITIIDAQPILSVERRSDVPDKFLALEAPGAIRDLEIRRAVWESIEKQDSSEHLRILMIDEGNQLFTALLIAITEVQS